MPTRPRRRIMTAVAIVGLLCALESAGRADPPPGPDDVQAVADKIDARIAAQWGKAGVVPGDPTDDAEFLRRVSLHLSGCIPPVSVARTFLDDRAPDKRRRYVEELLDEAGYVVNFSRFWRHVMIPAPEATEFRSNVYAVLFETWLRTNLSSNMAYDELARQVIRAGGDGALSTPARPGIARIAPTGEPSAIAFVLSRKSAPEEVASATARVFLGIRVECAQCHDHPFDHWKREEFWSFAAFFGGLVRQPGENFSLQISETPNKRELTIPNTAQVVQARYLGGSEPAWKTGERPRTVLSEWVASADNPYFARTAVNRIWDHLFGVGLVDPVDDFNEENIPSHPELLDELSAEFIRHGFDLKFLLQVIVSSKTYQLSSRRTHESQDDLRLFARMAAQGLTPAQIYDSLQQATGRSQDFVAGEQRFAINGYIGGEREFEEAFGLDSQAAARREATILQSLLMMNGASIAQATSLSGTASRSPYVAGPNAQRIPTQVVPSPGHTLLAVTEAPFLDLPARIETLYLATLTRKPSSDELRRVREYMESGKTEKEALADVFWALLNTTEFLLNH